MNVRDVSYICEQSKNFNEHFENTLRIAITCIKPDIDETYCYLENKLSVLIRNFHIFFINIIDISFQSMYRFTIKSCFNIVNNIDY